MSELLELLKPNSIRSTSARILSDTPITEGTESKSRIRLQIGERQIDMIRRTLSCDQDVPIPELIGFSERKSGALSEEYAFSIQLLLQRGLPVPPTVRILSPTEVVVTDVVAGGGLVYDVKAQAMEKMYYAQNRDRSQIAHNDTVFLSTDQQEATMQAIAIGNLATEQAVLLAEDSPFHIVFDSQQNWELMILDIAKMKIAESQEHFRTYLADLGIDLQMYNTTIVDRWVRSVKSLQDFLRK